jgi:hypothetical protein
MEFDREEAMEIAHKKRTEEETAKEDEANPKDKKRREKILGHTGDKKPDNNSSLQPQGDRKESNVSIQHTEETPKTEAKVNQYENFSGTDLVHEGQGTVQTKEQADTNEKVRQIKEVTEMEKEKERKAEAKEIKELKHDEEGNFKQDYTPTAEEKAKKKKERLAAAKKKEVKAKKTKKKVPETKLSEDQMKKLMEESAARDKNKTANDIIMDMNIMKLNLM